TSSLVRSRGCTATASTLGLGSAWGRCAASSTDTAAGPGLKAPQAKERHSISCSEQPGYGRSDRTFYEQDASAPAAGSTASDEAPRTLLPLYRPGAHHRICGRDAARRAGAAAPERGLETRRERVYRSGQRPLRNSALRRQPSPSGERSRFRDPGPSTG